jgi:ABC-type dipeptide/oligopeptide/nickel transport system ATPase component
MGNIVRAVYGDPGLEEYRNNPLVAALPPIMEPHDLREKLEKFPVIHDEEQTLPNAVRVHAVARLLHDFFQPLSVHVALESKISLLMRVGYKGRNPNTGDYYEHLQNGYERLVKGDPEAFTFQSTASTAQSLAFIGCSGCGKSTALEVIQRTYPKAIFHPDYNITQIPYLKLDCPHDGTLKSLCFSFFKEIDGILGTDYANRYGNKRVNIDVLLNRMAQIASLHAVGVLIIDELQHLKIAKSGGIEKMLNFIVTLVNTIGVSVIMVGTPWARRFFESDLRSARRAAGFGSLLWDRMPNDRQWRSFVKRLWRYQWLRQQPLSPADISDQLYDLSQGVIDIVVKLFALAQHRAIMTGVEQITPALLRQVYDDELIPVHPMLDALRSGKPELILKYGDLRMPDVTAKILDVSQDINIFAAPKKHKQLASNDRTGQLVTVLCAMGLEHDVAVALADEVLAEAPDLPIYTLVHLATSRMVDVQKTEKSPAKKYVQERDWSKLSTDDLRHQYAGRRDHGMYEAIQASGLVFDLTKGFPRSA